MALKFSAVKLTAQEKSSKLLVGGVPTGSEDLQGWTAFDNFMKDIVGEAKVNVQVNTYLYGEGEIVDADPAEVVYMKQRQEANPNFLNDRCSNIGVLELIFFRANIQSTHSSQRRGLMVWTILTPPHPKPSRNRLDSHST